MWRKYAVRRMWCTIDRKELYMEEVSLNEMLDAREARAAAQQQLLTAHKVPLVCLTLNIPGPVKVLDQVPQAFEEGLNRIASGLREKHIQILEQREIREKTGYEALCSVDGDPMELKAVMTAIEDSGRLGRLLDIDVIRTDGGKVSREDLGCPPRTCLLCGKPAQVCGRSRSHSVPELVREIQNILASEL